MGKRHKILFGGIIFLTILVVGGVFYGAWKWKDQQSSSSQLQRNDVTTPSSTNTPAVVAVTATPTETASTSAASTSPGASPIPTVTAAVLPDTAKAVIANFFVAYKAQDKARLSIFFTADSTNELKSEHATLFTGVGLNGDPGGPTLFATNTASQYATSYSILGLAPQGDNWIVTLSENRVVSNGQSIGSTTTLMTLVPGAAGQEAWLIDDYYRAGSSGKYSAFLVE